MIYILFCISSGKLNWTPTKSSKICSIHCNDKALTYKNKLVLLERNSVPTKYIDVRSAEEMTLLHQMGCFGKGSASRSRPMAAAHRDSNTHIMRKRQFLKRNYWYKKFGGTKGTAEVDSFLKEVDEVTAKIIDDGESLKNKEVIDLVSSDDNMSVDTDDDDLECNPNILKNYGKEDIVVIVPNSDSEEDNYFAKMKPKCCVNKIKLNEKLMLTPEESFFLLFGLGCLQIISLQNKILNIEECWDLFASADKNFIIRYVVYHYFRSKGYVVKPGIKFGGDYLLYKEGPEITHADYVVVISADDNGHVDDSLYTLGLVRMAHTTLKEILVAQVTHPKEPTKMPEGLKDYRVREILLSRNIPVTINDE